MCVCVYLLLKSSGLTVADVHEHKNCLFQLPYSWIYGLKETVTLLAILFNMQQNQTADPKLQQTWNRVEYQNTLANQIETTPCMFKGKGKALP